MQCAPLYLDPLSVSSDAPPQYTHTLSPVSLDQPDLQPSPYSKRLSLSYLARTTPYPPLGARNLLPSSSSISSSLPNYSVSLKVLYPGHPSICEGSRRKLAFG